MACVTASAELVAAVRTAKQFLTYVASGPFQYAVADALTLPTRTTPTSPVTLSTLMAEAVALGGLR